MAFPGHILREKRQSLGFSLQDITDHLSIPAIVINSLESGDLSHVPESSFATGFLRSYCTFLGIEAEMMIAELQKASRSARRLSTNRERSTFEFKLPKLSLPNLSFNVPTEVLAWIAITALLILGWVTYTTFAPNTDPTEQNETEATTIDLRVPDLNSGRDSR